ncbi:hypothetical protein LCGC14_2002810 [marine sediment metagenome]|uniref:BppU N-terminal domain-containing protein n=1 Tax=marine sediment metagenome TaxID=412755 RepID=A0A0F9HZR6_9ZZZZ
MVDPDWKEVEGTLGKSVYFTVLDSDGEVEDLEPYDEAKIQLKVWRNDGTTLKFEKDMNYVTDGTDGRVVAVLNLATDVAIGDEDAYFFTIELETAGGVIMPTVRGTFQIVQGAPA